MRNHTNQDDYEYDVEENGNTRQLSPAVIGVMVGALAIVAIGLVAVGTLHSNKPQNLNAVEVETIQVEATTETQEVPPVTEAVLVTEIPIGDFEEAVPETEAPTEALTEPPTEAVPQYIVVSGKYTWEEAQKACKSYGGNLATVHSDEEWNALIDAVNLAREDNPSLRYVWVGGTTNPIGNEISLSWIDRGETAYILGNKNAWYFNETSKTYEPSGYDNNEYQKSGSLIREPYVLLWMPNNADKWTLNDVPDLTAYGMYTSENMGYVLELSDSEIPAVLQSAETPSSVQ